MTNDVLMSIQPRFAEAIFRGEKTHELRRRFPDHLVGTRIYVYASTPVRAVLGTFRVASVERRPRWLLARTRRRATNLAAGEITSYLHGQHHGVLIEVAHQQRFPRPISLAELRGFEVEPPQSYRFLSRELSVELDHAGELSHVLHRTVWALATSETTSVTRDRDRPALIALGS